MITRLKKIIQIGVFRRTLDLGKLQFKKFTVFYALNTYGKTTLKDIFLSISNDDPNVIEKRRSIPHESALQDVVLSFIKNGTEHSLNYSNSWNPKDLKGKIIVFDNDFIHKNLITGFSITRENKESFTDFILGEEGVSLSEEIRLLNKELQDKKMALERPGYIKNSNSQNDIDSFLNLTITEESNDLKKSRQEIIRNIDNLSNIENLTKLPVIELPRIVIEEKISELIVRLNLILSKDYRDVTESVKEKLLSHVNQCTQGQGVKGWIKQGLKTYVRAGNCPFCGQNLANAHELIEAYNNFFNEKYEEYAKAISADLESINSELDKITISTHTEYLTLVNNLHEYKKYNPTINPGIKYSDIELIENDVKEKLKSQKDKLKNVISNKNNEPHKTLPEVSFENDFLYSLEKFKYALNNNEEINTEIDKASKLRNEHLLLSSEHVLSMKANFEALLQEVEKKLARIEQDSVCKKYLTEVNKISALNTQIDEKSNDLKNQQSDYIMQYFTELNRQFVALGSRDFTLSCVTGSRGHKKVYEIKICYKEKEISSVDIATILSESDKRSLAFSIFITKLNYLKNKSEFIIILDDPVVSFDDNRILSTIDIFKNICSNVGQVILLTHYSSLINKLINSKADCAYFEIVKNNETSLISELKKDVFVLSDQELAFEKIYSFIERETTDDISKDCRIFMEKYLKFRFQNEIKNKKIVFKNLSELIQQLFDNKLINESNFEKAENFRNSLNPDHHEFLLNKNAEDVRSYAKNLLTFIYQL